jgi:hypothetical protein
MYPMSLAQVWMHSIEFSFQTSFCNLFKFPASICTHQKFNNIFHILGLKIMKSTLLNQTWWRFSTIQKMPSNSNIVFNLGFEWKYGSIITKFHIVAPNDLNQVIAPLFI